MSRYYC